MIENYRTGRVWERFMQNVDIQRGLQRAGFIPATDVARGIGNPGFTLSQNFPNPIRQAAAIPFHLGAAGHVSLVLYDVTGRRVRSLVDGPREAGSHAVSFNAKGIPNGVYFIRLEVNGERRARPCVIQR